MISPEQHFINRPEIFYETYLNLLSFVETISTFKVEAVPTSINIRTGSTFLSIKVKNECLILEFSLNRKVEEPYITGYFQMSKNRIVHTVKLRKPEDISRSLKKLLLESYKIINLESK